MKICPRCGQLVAEEINTCPACGTSVGAGRKTIDDYRIIAVLHEGYSSILCKAVREGDAAPVMIRIFTPRSGVDAEVAERLKRELEELQALPEAYFVRHLEIKQSADGLWYRVSEWVEAIGWGSLLGSERLQDLRTAFRLFYRIASILEGLHQIGHIVPHLILDDILVYEDEAAVLKVKIDYKLSRFLDPQMDRPGPMLANLLASHPDIANRRPLDHRSDIWSLGKIFVEVLSADPEVSDLQAKVDTLPVPREVRTLIRLMLSEDPDLRPRSMAAVAATLGQVRDQAIEAAADQRMAGMPAPARAIRRLNIRLSLLLVLLALLIVVGGLLWYYLGFKRQDSEAALIGYANRYSKSVAFVVVDYWLQHGDRNVYHNRAEGTAFLADPEGYLLTNRHVACPWLEDTRLLTAVGLLRQRPGPLRFDYRMFMWFDGQRAFNRLPDLEGGTGMEDVYHIDSAFSTQNAPRVRIAGVARVPVKTWELIRSPLRDDFAVLRIDTVPRGLEPLPLDARMEAAGIPKLTPVIALGFPLGSRTQAMTVNVSVTQGNVRRTFENMFQVDTSIHSGNSGGPIIDSRGRVIGIASGVALGTVLGPVPAATPLSDIGMILPINKAAAFIRELKAGERKWNGVLDLALEERLQRITAAARQRRWDAAKDMADEELGASQDPNLVMAAAVMHLCAGDHSGGRRLFKQALSMDASDNQARLLLFFIDWLEGDAGMSAQRQPLYALDWRSADEFWGYVARILGGEVNPGAALGGGYTPEESSWLHLAAGLAQAREGDWTEAQALLRRAVMTADVDDWGYYISLAQLDRIEKQRLALLQEPGARKSFSEETASFNRRLEENYKAKRARREDLAATLAALRQKETAPDRKRALLEKLLAAEQGNRNHLIGLSFYSAMDDDWQAALDYARRFLKLPGRQSAGKLSLGLLEPEILQKLGRKQQSRQRLEDYHRRVENSWYRSLSACLLDPEREASVAAKAGENPAYLLTGHVAFGLWAEAAGDSQAAIRYYKEALGSYMDHRIEYEFARERIKRLRRQGS